MSISHEEIWAEDAYDTTYAPHTGDPDYWYPDYDDYDMVEWIECTWCGGEGEVADYDIRTMAIGWIECPGCEGQGGEYV